MKTTDQSINAPDVHATSSLVDFVEDKASEPRKGLVSMLRDLEAAIAVPEGQKPYLYVLSWKLPKNFFGEGTILNFDRVDVYDGFHEKLKNHDIAGLRGDIARIVRGRHKSVWRIIFCHLIFDELVNGSGSVQTRLAA